MYFRSHGITKDPNKFKIVKKNLGFMNSIILDLIIELVTFNVLRVRQLKRLNNCKREKSFI